MNEEERKACDLVERMLRELHVYSVTISADGAWTAVRAYGDAPSYDDSLAAAIERARAARSKP